MWISGWVIRLAVEVVPALQTFDPVAHARLPQRYRHMKHKCRYMDTQLACLKRTGCDLSPSQSRHRCRCRAFPALSSRRNCSRIRRSNREDRRLGGRYICNSRPRHQCTTGRPPSNCHHIGWMSLLAAGCLPTRASCCESGSGHRDMCNIGERVGSSSRRNQSRSCP